MKFSSIAVAVAVTASACTQAFVPHGMPRSFGVARPSPLFMSTAAEEAKETYEFTVSTHYAKHTS